MEFQLHFFSFILLVAVLTVAISLFIAYSNKFQKEMSHYLPITVSFGTGMLLSIAVEEFLPRTFEEGNHFTSLIIFLGVALVIFAEKYITPKINLLHHSDCYHAEGAPHFHHVTLSPEAACSSIGCIIVCSFFDGMEINAGFQLGKGIGWLVGFGFLFHCVLEGVVVASIAKMSGLTNRLTKWIVLIVGACILLGGIFGMFLKEIFGFENFVLPLASGVLLYVCFVHLLAVALRRKSSFFFFLLGGACFFLLSHFLHAV